MPQEARQFSIDHCLGTGGFGEVYLANMTTSSGVQSEVVLKVLHRDLDPRSQAVQRLRDEARLLGTLNHPSVLKVHDLVMLDDRVALVAEYVDGANFEICLELGMPLRPVLTCIARVAAALDAAWSATGPDGRRLELVHRDVKPANIQIGRHAQVKLLDFGIAKASDVRREARTEMNMRYIGTPWYMAPERFARVDNDPLSDVYSLGCCLYEAQTRKRLFEIDASEHFTLAIDRNRHDEWIAEAVRPLNLPEEVEALLLRMLAFQREDRPTAAELEDAVDEIVDDLDGPSLRKWCKRANWPNTVDNDAHGDLEGQTLAGSAADSGSAAAPVPRFSAGMTILPEELAPALPDPPAASPPVALPPVPKPPVPSAPDPDAPLAGQPSRRRPGMTPPAGAPPPVPASLKSAKVTPPPAPRRDPVPVQPVLAPRKPTPPPAPSRSAARRATAPSLKVWVAAGLVTVLFGAVAALVVVGLFSLL